MGRGGNPIYTEDQKKKHNEKLTTTAKVVKTKHTSRVRFFSLASHVQRYYHIYGYSVSPKIF